MEDNKLKFVVRGKKDGDKFVLEGITNFILQKMDSFDDKNHNSNIWKTDNQYYKIG